CHESSGLVFGFGRTNTITLPYCSLAFTACSSRQSVKNQKKARFGSGLNPILRELEETGVMMLHCGIFIQF
ncbi:hypothetical protein, partial [Pseudoduganella rivuli]|uniref:hypothetical protein n=1 Tax=Pseudoduganella rivuli TaxID=2666085 RepID=UPI001E412427